MLKQLSLCLVIFIGMNLFATQVQANESTEILHQLENILGKMNSTMVSFLDNIGVHFEIQNVSKNLKNGCKCTNYTCDCCVRLEVKPMNLNETACIHFSYQPNDHLDLIFELNEQVVYNETISITNPRSVCYHINAFGKSANLCINFYSVDIKNKSLSGCVEINADLNDKKIARIKFGCFKMANNTKFSEGAFMNSLMPNKETFINKYSNGIMRLFNNTGCKCVNETIITCECCAQLECKKINLNKKICLKMDYEQNEKVDVEFNLDDKIVAKQTVKISNPPAICTDLKANDKSASLCINLYEINTKNKTISGCIEIIANLNGKELTRVKFACFNTKNTNVISEDNLLDSVINSQSILKDNQIVTLSKDTLTHAIDTLKNLNLTEFQNKIVPQGDSFFDSILPKRDESEKNL